MAVGRVRRIFALVFLQLFCAQYDAYEIPEVNLEVLTPKGFRASIPDAPKISLFSFQGNLNRAIGSNDVGTLSGEVLQATDGRWVFEDPNVQLKVDDVINYYVFVSVDGAGYLKDKLSYTVRAFGGSTSPTQCQPTVTKVRGSSGVCAGQTIFEDNFDSLNEDLWQIEQYIPLHHPEFPFVSYQRLSVNPTVSVNSGFLRIAPKLQQNEPGCTNETVSSGNLNLVSGCTGSAEECSVQAWGASILPPVVSGRVTSKGLAFTYGTVHVRAKLPQGDWLYPELLLEPFLKKYGNMHYSSGVLKIATARGNKELKLGIKDFGNKVLYGGPIMDFHCRQYLIIDNKLTNGKMWGDDFHVYSVNWTPDRISLMIDMVEWASIEPSSDGLRGNFPPTCRDLPHNLLSSGTKMAPFDDHFYIALGVAAGGITEFNDDLYTTGGQPKPWRNYARKASLNFWQSMNAWYPTWNNPELLIDYVKVVAL